MSRPARPYGGDPCCDDRPPIPRDWIPALVFGTGSAGQQLRAAMRRAILEAGENPDELWCRGCSTVLEQVRDGVVEGGPAFLRLLSTVASVIPGIGTGIASVLGTAASLAEGKALDDALVDGALSALPGGVAWTAAGAAAKGVLQGQRIDRAALAGVRAGIEAEGGKLAAAAFDGLMAVAQGKSLQDSGFSALNALAEGNDLAERAAHYSEAIARAAEEGRSVSDVLVSELASDVAHYGGVLAFERIQPLIDRLKLDPSLLAAGPAVLASLYNVPEPLARAARAVMRDGVEDVPLRLRLAPRAAHATILTDSAGNRAAVAAAQKVASDAARASATSSVDRAKHAAMIAVFADAAPVVEAAPVEAPSSPPRAPRTSALGDVALGATIAAAVVAVVWWRSSS